MLQVLEYLVKVDAEFEIRMPYSAEMLKLEFQNGGHLLSALVNVEDEMVVRKFRIAKSNDPIDYEYYELDYIPSFRVDGTKFHIFEIK